MAMSLIEGRPFGGSCGSVFEGFSSGPSDRFPSLFWGHDQSSDTFLAFVTVQNIFVWNAAFVSHVRTIRKLNNIMFSNQRHYST